LRQFIQYIIFFICIIFCLPNLYGQQNLENFAVIGLENGLSHGTVSCILQDKLGFIWIGTNNGLNKYDGYEFKIYTENHENSESITGNMIHCLYESKDGMLWIGTDKGLNTYDVVTGKFQFLNQNTQDTLLGKMPVRTILEDKRGNIWIGTDDRLCKIDRKNNHIEIFRPNNKSLGITALHQDIRGALWIGTQKGLARFDELQGQQKRQKQFSIIIPNHIFRHITETQNGQIWAGSEAGLHILDISTNKHSIFPINTSVNSIFIDKQETIWIGTQTGLYKFNPLQGGLRYYSKRSSILNSLSNDHINCIYEDRIGSLWIGSNGGINRLSTLNKTFTHYQYVPMSGTSLSDNRVTAFLQDSKGTLWVGTHGGGLNKLDSITGEFLHFTYQPSRNRLSNNSVRAIAEDTDGSLWIGTENGLNHFDLETQEFRNLVHLPHDSLSLSDNFILALCHDSDSNLWVGTNGKGLGLLTNTQKNTGTFQTFTPQNSALSHSTISVIYETQNSNIWIGTQGGGLNYFDKKNKQFKYYTRNDKRKNNISSNFIWSILEDTQGNLWIGTSQGLNKWDKKTQKFSVYTVRDGLPNNVIYGILEYNNFLWLSTNKGISRFNLKTKKFRNFDATDGLQGNEFNGGAYYKNQANELFFGGNNGFNRFHPDKIQDNPHPPTTVITSLKIFNEEFVSDSQMVVKKTLDLPHENNFLQFEFSALNYIFSEKNQYEYKLENFDNEWIKNGTKRHATYTNLPTGDYVFRVRAANNDGVWNKEGTKIYISITPPFWQRIWFLALLIFIIGVILYRIYPKIQEYQSDGISGLPVFILAMTFQFFSKTKRLGIIVFNKESFKIISMDKKAQFLLGLSDDETTIFKFYDQELAGNPNISASAYHIKTDQMHIIGHTSEQTVFLILAEKRK